MTLLEKKIRMAETGRPTDNAYIDLCDAQQLAWIRVEERAEFCAMLDLDVDVTEQQAADARKKALANLKALRREERHAKRLDRKIWLRDQKKKITDRIRLPSIPRIRIEWS